MPSTRMERLARLNGLRGLGSMGDQQTALKDVAYGSTGASAAVSALAAAHIIGAGLVPFIGPAIAVATLVITELVKNSGCGQTCIQTSQWANQAADALQKNLDAYLALPTPRGISNQQLALQNFDAIWGRLVEMCSDPQWGDAGKRCVSDRQQGACKWQNGGQCWNWFIGYRDPIANDPNVGADTSFLTTGADGPGVSVGGVNLGTKSLLYIGAGLLLLGVMK